MLERGSESNADHVFLDLEDSVAPNQKVESRGVVVKALNDFDWSGKIACVRVNGLDTEWGHQDARAVVEMRPDAVLLPKVNSADDLDALAEITGDLPIWAMMETPQGMLRAEEIAAHPKLAGFVMGTNDLAKDLQCRFRADRLPLMASLGLCLLAAKAHGVVIVDGVYNAFKDDDGLRSECQQGRDMGMDGKTLIHPAQVAIANELFAPSGEDIDLAGRQIAAFEEAEAKGQGVAVVDGRIVENLHVATAREILAKAEAIAALSSE